MVEVVKATNGYAVRVRHPVGRYDERESILVATTPAELAGILMEALG